jgi:hypothetical protein
LKTEHFLGMHSRSRRQSHHRLHTTIPPRMKQFTPQQKHSILTHYRARSAGQNADDIAALHRVKGGRRVINQWLRRWDGTARSLERRAVSGRPRALSKVQVTRHVAAPIRNSNRAARAVRYPQLLPQVRAATGTEVSLRTLQRYGKEEAGGRKTSGKKRTADERACTCTLQVLAAALLHLCAVCLSDTCLCLTSSVS